MFSRMLRLHRLFKRSVAKQCSDMFSVLLRFCLVFWPMFLRCLQAMYVCTPLSCCAHIFLSVLIVPGIVRLC